MGSIPKILTIVIDMYGTTIRLRHPITQEKKSTHSSSKVYSALKFESVVQKRRMQKYFSISVRYLQMKIVFACQS